MDYTQKFEEIKKLYEDLLQKLDEPKINFDDFVKNIEQEIEQYNKERNPQKRKKIDDSLLINKIFDDNKLTYLNLKGLKTQINKHIGKIYSISKALKELEDFKNDKNYENHKKYLEYIKNIIFLKIYIDLRTFQILADTFEKTDKITRVMQSFIYVPVPNNYDQRIKDSKKIQNSLQNVVQTMSNVSNLSSSNVVNANLSINVLNTNIKKCKDELEKALSEFIDDLSIKQEGGDEYFYFKEINDKLQYNKEDFKKIKKSYEDGLKNNIEGFKELCKSIKEYLKKFNESVNDFLNSLKKNIN